MLKKIIKATIWKWYNILISRINIKYSHSGKVALCCMGKCENLYIREWVEYYKDLGVDKIFIYDNNDLNGEEFNEVISDYIDSGFCDIINFRGKTCCQEEAYHDCYIKHNKEYDWIAVFDIDEFLTLREHKNIHDFLKDVRFSNFQVIHINWMCYGDNEMLDYDGRKCQDRFITPLPYDIKRFKDFPENNHIKSIVRGNLKHINWRYITHTPWCFYKSCNPQGIECSVRSPYNPYNFDVAFLRHYYTKTIGEWIKIKAARGYGDMDEESAKKKLAVDVFFMLNKKTNQKEEYAKSLISKMNKNENLSNSSCL